VLQDEDATFDGTTGLPITVSTVYVSTTATAPTVSFSRYLGKKRYELQNHLGNVLAVIDDKKIGIPSTVFFKAEVISAQYYYAFGSTPPNVSGITANYQMSSISDVYRYGFGGQEKDDQITNPGNTYTAEHWEYDSRLGRRWNSDPIITSNVSPYSSFENNPIFLIDPDGAKVVGNSNSAEKAKGSFEATEKVLNDEKHFKGALTFQFSPGDKNGNNRELTMTWNDDKVKEIAKSEKKSVARVKKEIRATEQFKAIDKLISSPVEIRVELFNGDNGIRIAQDQGGLYQIDIADVNAFNGPELNRIGAFSTLIHELHEDYVETKDGRKKMTSEDEIKKEYRKAHAEALVVQAKVMGVKSVDNGGAAGWWPYGNGCSEVAIKITYKSGKIRTVNVSCKNGQISNQKCE